MMAAEFMKRAKPEAWRQFPKFQRGSFAQIDQSKAKGA